MVVLVFLEMQSVRVYRDVAGARQGAIESGHTTAGFHAVVVCLCGIIHGGMLAMVH